MVHTGPEGALDWLAVLLLLIEALCLFLSCGDLVGGCNGP